MRLLAACLIVLTVSSTAIAEDTVSPSVAAIDRGLAFLVQDAQKWKSEHQCVSCHHAALVAPGRSSVWHAAVERCHFLLPQS